MEPLLSAQKECAVFIPYRKGPNGPECFLQMRDENAPIYANMFSFFGGAIEGNESALEALQRELSEELEYEPRAAKYLCKVETWRMVYHVFIEEVELNFESTVVVHEGKYGKFLRPDEIDRSSEVSPSAQLAVSALVAYLK